MPGSHSSLESDEAIGRIPKFYTIGKNRYVNPAYIHTNVSNKALDNWPAHSSGRLHPTTQITINNEHHVKVLSEHESKLPNLVPKPKFLEFLEKHVKTELTRHKITEVEPNALRLQIYGEVFEWLLQALKSYRPLLASIKREYEMNIEHLRDELRKVEPMKELLWTLSQEYDQRLMAVRNQESQQIKTLKDEKSAIIKAVSDLKAERETLSVEVGRLKEEVEVQNNLCRTEADARKILISDMNDLRGKLKEMERLARQPEDEEFERDDPVKLRWAYDQAKIALTEANRKLVHMEANYSDVVPRKTYDELYAKHNAMIGDFDSLVVEKDNATEALNTLQNQYNAMYIQRDHLYIQLKQARQKLLSTNPLSKQERAVLEKNDMRTQNAKEHISDEANKWLELAGELSYDELVKKIEEELNKTDGSAEIMMEILMEPGLQNLITTGRGKGLGTSTPSAQSDAPSNSSADEEKDAFD